MIQPDSIRSLFPGPYRPRSANALGLRGEELSRVIGAAANTNIKTQAQIVAALTAGNRMHERTNRHLGLIIGNGNRGVAHLKAMAIADATYREEQAARESRLIRITREGFDRLVKAQSRGSGPGWAELGIAALVARALHPFRMIGAALRAPVTALQSAGRAVVGGVRAVGSGLTVAAGLLKQGVLAPLTSIRTLLAASAAVVGSMPARLSRMVTGLTSGNSVLARLGGGISRVNQLLSTTALRVTGTLRGIGSSLGGIGGAVAGLGRGINTRFIAPIGSALRGIFGSSGLFASAASAVSRISNALGLGAGFSRVGAILRPLGGLIGKIAWPITAILGVMDALRGWADAEKEFNTGDREASTLEKLSSATGRVLDSLTFGLTGWISEQFGFEKTSHLLKAAGERVASGFKAIYDSLPTMEQVQQFLTGGAGLFTREGILGVLTAPLRLGVKVIDWIGSMMPSWESITGAFTNEGGGFSVSKTLDIIVSPVRLVSRAVAWLWDQLPSWDVAKAAIDALPEGSRITGFLETVTNPVRWVARAISWVAGKMPSVETVSATIENVGAGIGNVIDVILSPVQMAKRVVDWLASKMPSWSTVTNLLPNFGGQQNTPGAPANPQLPTDRVGLTSSLDSARSRSEASSRAMGEARERLAAVSSTRDEVQNRRDLLQRGMEERAARRAALEQEIKAAQMAMPDFSPGNRRERAEMTAGIAARRTEIESLSRQDRADAPELRRTNSQLQQAGEAVAEYTAQLDRAKEADSRAVDEVNNLVKALQALREAVPAPLPPGADVPRARDPATGQILPNARGNLIYNGRVVPHALGGLLTEPRTFPMSGGRTGLAGEAGPEFIMPAERLAGGKMGVNATIAMSGVEIRLDGLIAATRAGDRRIVNAVEKSGEENSDETTTTRTVVVNQTVQTSALPTSSTPTTPAPAPSAAPTSTPAPAAVVPTPTPRPAATVTANAVRPTPLAGGTPLSGSGEMPVAGIGVPVSTLTNPSSTVGNGPTPPPAAPTAFNARARGAARPDEATLGAIASASRATGMDFGFMMAMAGQESSFNPRARASTSSAGGLYQFIDGTWESMVKNYGASHGLTMDGRNDPRQASTAAALFAQENASRIQRATGREPNRTDLYMGHFLGGGGAANFLRGMQANPNALATSLVSESTARSNPNIFYNAQGRPRSAQEVYNLFQGKIENRASGYVAEYGERGAQLAGGALPTSGTGSLPPGAVVAGTVGPGSQRARVAQPTDGMTTTAMLGGLLSGQISPEQISRDAARTISSGQNYFGGDTSRRGPDGRRLEANAGILQAMAARGITPSSNQALAMFGAADRTRVADSTRASGVMAVAPETERTSNARNPVIPVVGEGAQTVDTRGERVPRRDPTGEGTLRDPSQSRGVIQPVRERAGDLEGMRAQSVGMRRSADVEVPTVGRREGIATAAPTPSIDWVPLRETGGAATAAAPPPPAPRGPAAMPAAQGVGGRPSVDDVPVMDELSMMMINSFALG